MTTKNELCMKHGLTASQLDVLWQAARKHDPNYQNVLNLGKVSHYSVLTKTLAILKQKGFIGDAHVILEPQQRDELRRRSRELIDRAFRLASLQDPFMLGRFDQTEKTEAWLSVLDDLQNAKKIHADLAAKCLRLTDLGVKVAQEYIDMVGEYDAPWRSQREKSVS